MEDVKKWKIISFLFIGLFLASLSYILLTTEATTGRVIATNKCTESLGRKVVEYINENLVRIGEAHFVNISDRGSYCKIVTEYMGRNIPVYVTKDGKTLFLQAINLTKPLREKFDAPDTKRPTVYLFVMSFCPFGNQAENAMKPVVNLLKDKINMKVVYIVDFVNKSGPNTLDIGDYHIVSLHGPGEAWEDLIETCIQKYYPNKFWDYIVSVNHNCSDKFFNITSLNNCWRPIAESLGIDTKFIENCAKTEGVKILLNDTKLVEKYHVMGSPTLVINGKVYEGPRTPNAFKEAICSGFVNPPKECEVRLTNSVKSTSGSCS